MANIRMIISLHDNDFWFDMNILGEFLTSTMKFFDSHKIDQSLLDNEQYRISLKCVLVDLLISIYKLRLLVDPHSGLNIPFDLIDYTKNVEHVSNWFKAQFDLYFTEDEFSKAMEFISSDCLSKPWNEIRFFDEFQMCNGNYEYLIIHCSEWENKFVIV